MIYTLGYEGLSIKQFLTCLKWNDVKVLVDVRDYPLSRKTGFSKKALSSALEDVCIEYQHWRDLGAPKEVRYALKATGDWQAYRSAYLELLDKKARVLNDLADVSKQATVCLMCFERYYKECHRSLITERLQQQNLVRNVEHLDPKTSSVATAA